MRHRIVQRLRLTIIPMCTWKWIMLGLIQLPRYPLRHVTALHVNLSLLRGHLFEDGVYRPGIAGSRDGGVDLGGHLGPSGSSWFGCPPDVCNGLAKVAGSFR